MIQTEHVEIIDAGIDTIWDYVKDIGNWANIFPGCNRFELIDESNSRWVIKVGTGGMVKVVTVLVNVSQWDGPGRVDFDFQLEAEPVSGNGSYTALPRNDQETEIKLALTVAGTGQMAPMWEAMSKPLLPQMAGAFAGKLKGEIEALQMTGPEQVQKTSFLHRLLRWLRNIGWAVLGSPTEKSSRVDGAIAQMETNKKVVLSFLEAMSTSNAALADSCLAADAFTVAKGFGKFAGVRQRDTMVGTIDSFNQLLPTGLGVEVKSVTASGNAVAVEFEGNATTSEGKPYNNQYCMVFMLADGKIKQVNEYFCNVLADEVLWPLIEQQGQ